MRLSSVLLSVCKSPQQASNTQGTLTDRLTTGARMASYNERETEMSKDLLARMDMKAGAVAALKKDLAPAPKATSSADRREDLKRAIAEMDGEKIESVREVMTRYVDSMVTLDPEQTSTLTPTQSKALMEEDVLRREIADLIEARKETIKELVFRAITEEAAEAGAEDPELTNGEIVVEELGRRFSREGAGYSAPTFNLKTLKTALGDDAAAVIKTETKVVESVDEDALNSLLAGNPELIENVRAAMVPGKVRKGSFYNREARDDK